MACHVGNQAEMVTAFHDFKKNAQHERCELSFIWGKMRTAAWEAIYKVLGKGEFSTMNHSIYKRFFVSHEGLMSP